MKNNKGFRRIWLAMRLVGLATPWHPAEPTIWERIYIFRWGPRSAWDMAKKIHP